MESGIKPMKLRQKLICLILIFFYNHSYAATDEIERLKIAYPESIQEVSNHYITWKDGTRMLVRQFPLMDQLMANVHKVDLTQGSISIADVTNDNLEVLFRKMYGNSSQDVKKNLVTIYWMSGIYGKKYPLNVTTVNGVDKRLLRISSALEKLPSSYHKYVAKPASSFYWRNVAKETYLSLHSFGIAIDINLDYSNYWLWDFIKAKKEVKKMHYKNRIPMEIVEIFEKEGFAWGGRWFHYDTMHFEYRPDLFV